MMPKAEFVATLRRSKDIDVAEMIYIVGEIRDRLDRAAAWAEDGRRKQPGGRAMLDDVLVYLQLRERLIGVRAMIEKEEGRTK